jgi:hypothetical protein
MSLDIFYGCDASASQPFEVQINPFSPKNEVADRQK